MSMPNEHQDRLLGALCEVVVERGDFFKIVADWITIDDWHKNFDQLVAVAAGRFNDEPGRLRDEVVRRAGSGQMRGQNYFAHLN